MEKYLLKLYITGQSPRSLRAVENIKRLCERELPGRYDLVVIDLHDHPDVAEQENILATPTVVKEKPAPMRRVIGDLSDARQVLLGFDLPHRDAAEPRPGSQSAKLQARKEE